jgi:hypothetical protein
VGGATGGNLRPSRAGGAAPLRDITLMMRR